MVDGSRQGFLCGVGGKKIKIKTCLPNTVGGKKTLQFLHVGRGKKKKKRLMNNKNTLFNIGLNSDKH